MGEPTLFRVPVSLSWRRFFSTPRVEIPNSIAICGAVIWGSFFIISIILSDVFRRVPELLSWVPELSDFVSELSEHSSCIGIVTKKVKRSSVVSKMARGDWHPFYRTNCHTCLIVGIYTNDEKASISSAVVTLEQTIALSHTAWYRRIFQVDHQTSVSQNSGSMIICMTVSCNLETQQSHVLAQRAGKAFSLGCH